MIWIKKFRPYNKYKRIIGVRSDVISVTKHYDKELAFYCMYELLDTEISNDDVWFLLIQKRLAKATDCIGVVHSYYWNISTDNFVKVKKITKQRKSAHDTSPSIKPKLVTFSINRSYYNKIKHVISVWILIIMVV